MIRGTLGEVTRGAQSASVVVVLSSTSVALVQDSTVASTNQHEYFRQIHMLLRVQVYVFWDAWLTFSHLRNETELLCSPYSLTLKSYLNALCIHLPFGD